MASECSICGSKQLSKTRIDSDTSNLPGIPPAASFFRCGSCKSLSLLPIPNSSQLTDLYKNYFTYDTFQASDLKTYKEVLSRHKPTTKGRIKMLDIGAGGGHWSRAATSLNFDVTINDLNPNVIEKLADLKVKLEIGFFEDINFSHKFDLIIAMNVFEHLSFPKQFVEKVYENLNSGGVFILKTPLANSLAERLDGTKWQHFYELGHIVFISKSEMKNLHHRQGFKLVQYVAGGFPPFLSAKVQYVEKENQRIVESKEIKKTNLKFRLKYLIANNVFTKKLYLKILQVLPIGDSGYWYFKK